MKIDGLRNIWELCSNLRLSPSLLTPSLSILRKSLRLEEGRADKPRETERERERNLDQFPDLQFLLGNENMGQCESVFV